LYPAIRPRLAYLLDDWGQLMSTASTPILGIILAVVVMVPPEAIAQDQQKCASLQPVAGASGYKLRPGDVRCEGFYQSPVSGARVELFSLTSGALNYDLPIKSSTSRLPTSAPWMSARRELFPSKPELFLWKSIIAWMRPSFPGALSPGR
jgi:hypothetical protein